MTISDLILLVTLGAIVWYTLETRKLRKWQQLHTMLTVFFEQTKDWDSGMKVRTKYPFKLQEIVKNNEYDPSWAYSKGWHLNDKK